MTESILNLIACIGFAVFLIGIISIWKSKGDNKKRGWALVTAGQVLVLPYATVNLITERNTLFRIVFLIIWASVFVAMYYLMSSNEPTKK
jgi:uncharacterized membrane protein HdeD (DUF308 family)